MKRRHQMRTTRRFALQFAKISLALLGCILMPVLIWVAMGIAIYQKTAQKEVLKERVPTFG